MKAARAYLWLRIRCLQVAYLVLFGRWKPQPTAGWTPTTILVYRTCALGDFLLSIPALRVLRQRFPAAKIYLLTTTGTSKGRLEEQVRRYVGSGPYPWLEFAIPALVDGALTFDGTHPVSAALRLRAEIGLLRPDVAVILGHPGEQARKLIRKLVFLKAIGLPEVVGWRAKATVSQFRAWQSRHGMYRHKVFGPVDSVYELTGKSNDSGIQNRVVVPDAAKGWAVEWIRRNEAQEKSLIAVAPGSVQPHKRWPPEKFVALMQALAAEDADSIFVTVGTPADAALHDEIASCLPPNVRGRFHSIAGIASITQAAALLERSSFLIANDGGAAHLAAAVGCPVVAIIPGLESSGVVDPWGWQKYSVRHEVPCAPCYSFSSCPLGHNRCMRDVEVSAVLAAANRLRSDLMNKAPMHR